MKTLDEVIDWYENRKAVLTGKATRDEMEEDILYYLKMYRSDKALYEADRKNWEDDLSQKLRFFDEARNKLIAKYKELDIGTLNEPLTWDELRTMEGKPVWVETKYYSSRWAVITDIDDVKIRFVGKKLFDSEIVQEMGDTWQAYRKEHHE